jgi:hypothetical protein
MMFIFYIIVSAAVVAYFVGFGIVLVFAMIDKQKDSTMDNKITAFFLFVGLIVVPLLGVITSLPGR